MTATETGAGGEAFRVEKDALGEVRVPADRYWGAQTQRSVENFRIGVGRFTWGRPVIRALGILKLSAARANLELGQLTADKAALIETRPARWSTAGSTASSRSSCSRPARAPRRT